MSKEEALSCPIDQAFAFAAFHAETNPYAQMERASAGYIAQETERKNNL